MTTWLGRDAEGRVTDVTASQAGGGTEGPKGDKGDPGEPGTNGTDGAPGASAYEVAVAGGFSGTEAEWLASLKGDRGDDGIPGQDGQDGDPGTPGDDGQDGAPGASAYEIAVADGFSGTEAEWLASLVGAKGDKGDKGDTGDPGTPGSDATIPAGVIWMWAGLLSAIPTGWALCDGQNGTPDLRGKFIKGSAAAANPGATGGSSTHNHAAHSDHTVTQPTATGESAHTHTYTQVPNHVHPEQLQGSTSGATTGTNIIGSTATGGSLRTAGQSTANPTGGVATGTTAAGSSHTHTLSGAAVSAHSAHDSVNHEPAYYALAFIQKL